MTPQETRELLELAAYAIGLEPVAAQVRFRHPQKSTPDWSDWQSAKIDKDRKSYYIDSQGYEVEYRLLYLPPAPADLAAEYTRGRNDGWEAAMLKVAEQAKAKPVPEGMVMVPREPTHAMCQVSSEPMAAKHLYLAMIAAAEKEVGKCSR